MDMDVDMNVDMDVDVDVRMHTQIFTTLLLADSVGLVFEFAFAVRMAREMDRIGSDQNESDRISAVIGTIDASARLL